MAGLHPERGLAGNAQEAARELERGWRSGRNATSAPSRSSRRARGRFVPGSAITRRPDGRRARAAGSRRRREGAGRRGQRGQDGPGQGAAIQAAAAAAANDATAARVRRRFGRAEGDGAGVAGVGIDGSPFRFCWGAGARSRSRSLIRKSGIRLLLGGHSGQHALERLLGHRGARHQHRRVDRVGFVTHGILRHDPGGRSPALAGGCQRALGPLDGGFDRLGRAALRRRHLGEALVLHVFVEQGPLVVRRQLGQRQPDQVLGLRALEAPVRCRLGARSPAARSTGYRRPGGRGRAGGRSARFLAMPQTQVWRLERPSNRWMRRERGEEGLLGDVLGVLPDAADPPEHEGVDRLEQLAVERLGRIRDRRGRARAVSIEHIRVRHRRFRRRRSRRRVVGRCLSHRRT